MILSTTNFSNRKLGCKEDLINKQVENLIKETSRKLNRNGFEFYPTSLFHNHTMKKEQSKKY